MKAGWKSRSADIYAPEKLDYVSNYFHPMAAGSTSYTSTMLCKQLFELIPLYTSPETSYIVPQDAMNHRTLKIQTRNRPAAPCFSYLNSALAKPRRLETSNERLGKAWRAYGRHVIAPHKRNV